MKTPLYLIVAVFATLAFSPYARANLITNGDFATGDFTGWNVTHASSGSNLTVANGAAVFAASGSGFDSISQSFATTTGTFYSLNFDLFISNAFQNTPDTAFQVLFNGTVIFSSPNINAPLTTLTFTNLQAIGSSTNLVFRGRRNNPGFIDLDNVDVTTGGVVPDTGRSALLMTIGLLGLFGFRRVLSNGS
jgi:hypothetical protein